MQGPIIIAEEYMYYDGNKSHMYGVTLLEAKGMADIPHLQDMQQNGTAFYRRTYAYIVNMYVWYN